MFHCLVFLLCLPGRSPASNPLTIVCSLGCRTWLGESEKSQLGYMHSPSTTPSWLLSDPPIHLFTSLAEFLSAPLLNFSGSTHPLISLFILVFLCQDQIGVPVPSRTPSSLAIKFPFSPIFSFPLLENEMWWSSSIFQLIPLLSLFFSPPAPGPSLAGFTPLSVASPCVTGSFL